MFSWGKAVYEKAAQGKKNFSRYHVKQLFAVYQSLQGIMKWYLKFARDNQSRWSLSGESLLKFLHKNWGTSNEFCMYLDIVAV